MFYSRISRDLQRMIGEVTDKWPCRSFFVTPSTDFVIERILHSSGRSNIVSGDVTLPAHALGAYVSGIPITLQLQPEYEGRLSWLAPYLDSPIRTVATALLAKRLLSFIGEENPYYARMYRAYRDQWPTLHAKIVDRLGEFDLRLSEFRSMDVHNFVCDAPEDAGLICCPVFNRGGEAALIDRYAEVLTWTARPHTVPDADALASLYENVRERPYWILSLAQRRPDMETYLCGTVKTTNCGNQYFLYSSTALSRHVGPSQACEPVRAPSLLPGQSLGNRLSVSVLRWPQFNSLRSRYLNANIAPSRPRFSVAVTCDGCVIGVLGFKIDDRQGSPDIILISDFPVSATDYPRLSKLIVCAALSTEVKLLCERALGKRVDNLRTIVFTNNHSSMKYRGLFSEARTDAAKGSKFERQITYTAAAGRWTLSECLDYWRARWCDRRTADANLH